MIVNHYLASIFEIETRTIYLDIKSKTIIIIRSPREILDSSKKENVIFFLLMGKIIETQQKTNNSIGRKKLHFMNC
jgi:hypothetical protein